jgi:hypothetical protein
LGSFDEDEFILNLLNEQSIWSGIVVTSPGSSQVEQSMIIKRFLTRTARYGGLLNVLEVAQLDINSEPTNSPELSKLFSSANSWVALNVSQQNVPRLAELALQNGLERVIFSVSLSPENINQTVIPQFEYATQLFKNHSPPRAFTGQNFFCDFFPINLLIFCLFFLKIF